MDFDLFDYLLKRASTDDEKQEVMRYIKVVINTHALYFEKILRESGDE